MTITVHYQQTPPGIMLELQLFTRQNIQYLLLKCEHIFEGKNKNVDVLFETDEDCFHAARLLEEQGFVERFSEKFEPYKRMYCGLVTLPSGEKTFHSFHLHREIAWHGIKTLEKKLIFGRTVTLAPLIIVPSFEDTLLIHAAHVLFENFSVQEREKKYFEKRAEADKSYLQMQLEKNGWKGSFEAVVQRPLGEVPISLIISTWTKKLLNDSSPMYTLAKKAVKKALRKLQWQRKGFLIALIGPNGAGKTSLTKELFEHYRPLTAHLHGQKGYYFGWDPFLPTAKIAQKFQGKKGAYQQLNETSSFSLFKESILIYTFLDYLARYWFHIFPALRKGNLVITDRYYYDVPAQQNYAEKSVLQKMLTGIFPKPDFTYVLDAPTEILRKRDKNNAVFSTTIQRNTERVLHAEEDLNLQIRRYQRIQQKISAKNSAEKIDTTLPLHKNAEKIVQETWKRVVEHE